LPDDLPEVTAFAWVPPFARGQVRDLRVRWALEELGRPYRVRLLSGPDRPKDYFREQPWGQVPAYREGAIRLFECGAIALHIAESDPEHRLLPRDSVARGRAISWLFAALNSVDPQIGALNLVDLFEAESEWARAARSAIVARLDVRLGRLADWLGQRDWLEDRFTVGDLLMVATLRSIDDAELLAGHPTLSAYVVRGEARPAFQRALAAQLADFVPDPA
jgi:glutathione S-transferase